MYLDRSPEFFAAINCLLSAVTKSWASEHMRNRGFGYNEKLCAAVTLPAGVTGYRASVFRERDAGGVGLGLAITERSVKLHHGNVAAQNSQDGRPIVTIQLPPP
jgi:hypothetical protein